MISLQFNQMLDTMNHRAMFCMVYRLSIEAIQKFADDSSPAEYRRSVIEAVKFIYSFGALLFLLELPQQRNEPFLFTPRVRGSQS